MSSTIDTSRFFEELRYALDTRPNDLDVLGHVNNAVVLEYLEAARWDWARRMGLQSTVLGQQSVVVVVSRVEIDYVAEILPGRVDVKTALGALDPDWMDGANYKVVVRQSIVRQGTGEDLVRATVVLAFVDAATRTLCTLQDALS